MNTLTDLKNNTIVSLVRENIILFEAFGEVYLFGSVSEENRIPKDIDILLICFEDSGEGARDTSHIFVSLENLLGMPVDLTVLLK